jgi:hypothetical protein
MAAIYNDSKASGAAIPIFNCRSATLGCDFKGRPTHFQFSTCQKANRRLAALVMMAESLLMSDAMVPRSFQMCQILQRM